MEERLKRIADCTSMKRLFGGDESNHSEQSRNLTKTDSPVDIFLNPNHSAFTTDDSTIPPDIHHTQSNNNCYFWADAAPRFIPMTGISIITAKNEQNVIPCEVNVYHFLAAVKATVISLTENLCSSPFSY